MAEGQQSFVSGLARRSIASTVRKGWMRNFAETHLLSLGRNYAQILRGTIATPVGAVTFVVATLVWVGLFLWLSGMLVFNSQLNYYNVPKVIYDLNPKGTQPYLIFIPIPDILLFVNLTAAVVTLALGGLVGLSVTLLVYSWRRVRGARRGGGGLVFGILPTLVQYLGLGCCGTPAFPVLLGLLPSSVATFGVRLGIHYNLMIGAIVALMAGAIIFTLERIRRANLCTISPARCQQPHER